MPPHSALQPCMHIACGDACIPVIKQLLCVCGFRGAVIHLTWCLVGVCEHWTELKIHKHKFVNHIILWERIFFKNQSRKPKKCKDTLAPQIHTRSGVLEGPPLPHPPLSVRLERWASSLLREGTQPNGTMPFYVTFCALSASQKKPNRAWRREGAAVVRKQGCGGSVDLWTICCWGSLGDSGQPIVGPSGRNRSHRSASPSVPIGPPCLQTPASAPITTLPRRAHVYRRFLRCTVA